MIEDAYDVSRAASSSEAAEQFGDLRACRRVEEVRRTGIVAVPIGVSACTDEGNLISGAAADGHADPEIVAHAPVFGMERGDMPGCGRIEQIGSVVNE